MPTDRDERHSGFRPEAGKTPQCGPVFRNQPPGISDKLGYPSCFNGGKSAWIQNGIQGKRFGRPIRYFVGAVRESPDGGRCLAPAMWIASGFEGQSAGGA